MGKGSGGNQKTHFRYLILKSKYKLKESPVKLLMLRSGVMIVIWIPLSTLQKVSN